VTVSAQGFVGPGLFVTLAMSIGATLTVAASLAALSGLACGWG